MFRINDKHSQAQLFQPEEELPEAMKSLLRNHWSETYYEKLFSKIDESIFAPLYCGDNGRPNFPVNILVGLEILKEIHTLTDEQLYENYLFNYTYHKALGIENIVKNTFTLRTLYNFRAIHAEHENKTGINLMMEVFRDGRDHIIEELGLKTGTQRIDSVMIGANIKKMHRLMLFHKTLSNLVRELDRNELSVTDNIRDILKKDEDSFSYRISRDEVAKTIVKIGEMIHSLITLYKNEAVMITEKAFLDANRLLEEQCVIRGKDQPIELKDPKEISSSSMQNPSDTDATFRTKRKETHRGFMTQAAETCDPTNPMQVITHVNTVQNNKDDAAVFVSEMKTLKDEMGLDIIIEDGGFVSESTISEAKKLDVFMVPTAIRGKKSKDNALTTKHFSFDSTGLVSECPAGHAPRSQSKDKDGIVTANYDPQICKVCALRNRCIAALTVSQSRLVVDESRLFYDERRELLKTEDYRNLCRLRPGVEGLMDKLKPDRRGGRTLFRGLPRVSTRMILRAIGLNFRRYSSYNKDLLLNFQLFIIVCVSPATRRVTA